MGMITGSSLDSKCNLIAEYAISAYDKAIKSQSTYAEIQAEIRIGFSKVKLNQGQQHYMNGFLKGMLECFVRQHMTWNIGTGFFWKGTNKLFMKQ